MANVDDFLTARREGCPVRLRPESEQSKTVFTALHNGASRSPSARLVLADPHLGRRARIRLAAGAGAIREVADLSQAFSAVEELEPDAIAIAAELTGDSGIAMFADLVEMVRARALVYGDVALYRVPTGLARRLPFVPFEDTASPHELLAYLYGLKRPPWRAVTPAPRGPELLLIGASTGGIAAIETIVSAFPSDCPPTLVVQHIRPGFIESTIARLERTCRPRILLASDGQPLSRGCVYVAADPERHLVLAGFGKPRCKLVAQPPRNGHRPSVDSLFHSATPYASVVAAALLTGMGADGAAGLKALRDAGAFTIAQDRATSVVWGMPRVATEIGAALAVLPVDRIAEALLAGRADQAAATALRRKGR